MIIKFYWTKEEYRAQALRGVLLKRSPVIALLVLYTAASLVRLALDGHFGLIWITDVVVYVYGIVRIAQTVIGVMLQCRNLKKVYVTMKLQPEQLEVEMIVDPYRSAVTKKWAELKIKESADILRVQGTKHFNVRIPKGRIAEKEVLELKKRIDAAGGR